jgi:hypothetical protein
MSERLPYDDAFEKMNDLPLPDSEAAWQKMEQLLDEEDKKRRIIPPVFLNCAGWGALLLVALIAGWFLLEPQKWFAKKESAQEKEISQSQKNSTTQKSNAEKESLSLTTSSIDKEKKQQTHKDNGITLVDKKEIEEQENGGKTSVTINANRQITTSNSSVKTQKKLVAIKNNRTNKKYQNFIAKAKEVPVDKNNKISSTANPDTTKNLSEVNKTNTTITTNTTNTAIANDTTKKQTIPEASSADSSYQKPKQQTKKPYYVTAGVGVQQAINTDGQTTVPYDYYGRKSSLADYIPSVYVRLHRGEKWFFQGEFRYGAPQSVKEFSFSRITKYDTSNTTLTTTITRIKKTYYHQVPLSFNYYVLPNWSVGVGEMYSLFHGAITEQEVKNKNIQTGAETSVKQVVRIPNYTDSFLYKTQWHILFQTDYQWKRFSLGLRYQKDLQPFIKYTDPSGELHVERNQSFDVFLRFALWRSKDFKL